MGRTLKDPIYVTPKCGIAVIGESLHVGSGRWRCFIRRHPLFPDVMVWRNRLIMTEHMGRRLNANEHVHHRSENKADDSLGNLEVLTAAKHNRHHKMGRKHKAISKNKISATLKKKYASGAMVPHPLIGVRNRSAKLNPERVQKMRALYVPGRTTYQHIAAMFGITKQSAMAAIKRNTWSHVK